MFEPSEIASFGHSGTHASQLIHSSVIIERHRTAPSFVRGLEDPDIESPIAVKIYDIPERDAIFFFPRLHFHLLLYPSIPDATELQPKGIAIHCLRHWLCADTYL